MCLLSSRVGKRPNLHRAPTSNEESNLIITFIPVPNWSLSGDGGQWRHSCSVCNIFLAPPPQTVYTRLIRLFHIIWIIFQSLWEVNSTKTPWSVETNGCHNVPWVIGACPLYKTLPPTVWRTNYQKEKQSGCHRHSTLHCTLLNRAVVLGTCYCCCCRISEYRSPSAEMASPRPTVLSGCLQTSTGVM